MLKRPLVSAAVLFIFGVILAAYNINLPIIGIFCFLAFVFAFYKTKKLLLSVIALLLIVAGIGRMNISDNSRDKIIAAYDGKKENARLTVTDFSERNSVTAYFCENGKKHKVLLRYESDVELSPGDIVAGEVTFYAPFTSKVTLPNYAHSLAGYNIFLTAQAEKITLEKEKEGGITGFFHSLRSSMSDLGDKRFTDDNRALFNAMVLGDKSLLSDELYASLQAGGLNHIAVVSGMHLSVAIAALTVISHLFFGKRRRSYLFVFLGTLAMVALTGAGTGVTRAFIMCSLYLLSKLLYRDSDSLTSLSFAALLMVASNPFIIFNLGFILSVLSVLGILLYNKKVSDFLKRFTPHALSEVLALSISAQVMVFPVLIYYFSTITPYSLLSNALLVPVAGIYVILGMLFILCSPIPVISDLFVFVIKVLSDVISLVSGWVKTLPASLITASGNYLVFSAIWVVLLILLHMHPVKRSSRPTIALSVAVIFAFLIATPTNSGTQIYPIVYGSATMTIVHCPDSESFFVDCPDRYDITAVEDPSSPFTAGILSTGNPGKIFKADTKINRIVVSNKLFKGQNRKNLISDAESLNIQLIFLDDGEKLQIGDAVVEFLPVEGVKNSRIFKIYLEGKTYLSFQGFRGTDIMEFGEKGLVFDSDYVILPYTAFAADKKVFKGKILSK